MKTNLLIALLIVNLTSFGQTFSGSSLPIAHNSWNGTKNIIVPVSGLSSPLTVGSLELVQVNVFYGNSSNNVTTLLAIDVISPAATNIDIRNSGTGSSKNRYEFKVRDNSILTTIASSGSVAYPFDIGFYRTVTANSFSSVIGENPNGNWIVRFSETSGFPEPMIDKVELIFGYIEVDDITGSTANDACATAHFFCDDKAIVYNNTNHTGDAVTDPPLFGGGGSNSCAWNNNHDNTGWFAWVASSTTAKIEISGISSAAKQQIIAVGNSTGANSCVGADYVNLTGGCPTDAVNAGVSYSNGSIHNMVLNVSGLTIGEYYYLLVDGEAGAQSDAYLTMTGGATCISLPIELTSFVGENKGNYNELSWTTATEINNDYFTIERSIDAFNWGDIGKVEGAGNSSNELNYLFNDDALSDDLYYYRLKQTDFDGQFSYSDIISIRNNKSEEFLVYPNPFDDEIKIKLSENTAFPVNIEMVDYLGRVVFKKTIERESRFSLLFNEELKAGTYFLKIFNQKESIVKKVIKLK